MKKNLDEKELDAVSGGDNGDRDKEQSETPEGVRFMYNVGDRVEVYKSDYHVKTLSATIIERTITTHKPGCTQYYLGYYKVEYDEGGTAWKTVADIQSKN